MVEEEDPELTTRHGHTKVTTIQRATIDESNRNGLLHQEHGVAGPLHCKTSKPNKEIRFVVTREGEQGKGELDEDSQKAQTSSQMINQQGRTE